MYVHFKEKIGRVIAELEIWFHKNDLVINVSKTGVTSFHNRQSKLLVKPQVSFNVIVVHTCVDVNP